MARGAAFGEAVELVIGVTGGFVSVAELRGVNNAAVWVVFAFERFFIFRERFSSDAVDFKGVLAISPSFFMIFTVFLLFRFDKIFKPYRIANSNVLSFLSKGLIHRFILSQKSLLLSAFVLRYMKTVKMV